MNNLKKFIFLVQGEGRGHMTQAISMYQILTKAGHRVEQVFIGKSDRRIIPEYFFENFSCPVEAVSSPNFVSDKHNRSIRLIPSIFYNLKFLGRYYKSLKKIHCAVKTHEPDYIINFYEFLSGYYYLLFHPRPKHIPVGHQFLSEHPSFPFAPGFPVDKFLFRMNNYFTSIHAYKKIALSFYEYPALTSGNMVICPPLLRHDIRNIKPRNGTFILAYLVNDGYSRQVITWHEKNRNVAVHCFWDKKNEPEEKSFHENLTFHQLNAQKFMDMMAACRGLVSTAGFESVCEAMYLGKPVMMIPVEGQYEQACNAIDAVNAGAGIKSDSFHITELVNYISEYIPVKERFAEWLNKTESIILNTFSEP